MKFDWICKSVKKFTLSITVCIIISLLWLFIITVADSGMKIELKHHRKFQAPFSWHISDYDRAKMLQHFSIPFESFLTVKLYIITFLFPGKQAITSSCDHLSQDCCKTLHLPEYSVFAQRLCLLGLKVILVAGLFGRFSRHVYSTTMCANCCIIKH